MRRTRGWTVALAALAVCALMPATALAAKGGGGTPAPSSAPCATLTPANPGQSFSRGVNVRARFDVTNCSAAPITLSTGFSSIATPWTSGPITSTPVPCAGPVGAGPTLTLKGGDRQTVELSVPPTTCPMGPSGAILEVDASARSATATLARATAFYQLTIKP
jgi:hypothetical protein